MSERRFMAAVTVLYGLGISLAVADYCLPAQVVVWSGIALAAMQSLGDGGSEPGPAGEIVPRGES